MRAYTQKYTLKTCDFDSSKHLRPVSLFFHLQDISTRHFNSVVSLKDEGVWVIVSWDIELYTQKLELEHLIVKTEPTYFRKFIGYRRYEVYRENGELVAKGHSKWVYIDQHSRKPKSISSEIPKLFQLEVNEKPLDVKLEPLNNPDVIANHHHFTIYDSDIDINHHVNNVVYIRWAMDVLMNMTSEDFHHKALKNIHVRYKKEMHRGGHARLETSICHQGAISQTVQHVTNEKNDLCAEVVTFWSH